MPSPEVVKRVRALMARATDPGATEEEQRTSAHIAAKLCREHGLSIGALGEPAPPAPPLEHARAEVVINGVRTVVETVRSSADAAFGFDVFAFAQELLRERAKEAITDTLKKPARPAKRRTKRR